MSAEREAAGLRNQVAGMVEVSRRRKEASRDQLRSAATRLFCSRGYHLISVDDIAREAGVSRVTFYRHFGSKAGILGEIFDRAGQTSMPRLTSIRDADFLDASVVRAWLANLFEADRANRQILQAFSQALKIDKEFQTEAQKLMFDFIAALGQGIAAFDVDPERGLAERRQWTEAWLVLYDILDQSNQAALDVATASDPVMLDVLAFRFVDFVKRHSPPGEHPPSSR